jgi:hypothetical protein
MNNEEINPFELAQKQFDQVADMLELPEDVRLVFTVAHGKNFMSVFRFVWIMAN